MGAPSDVTQRSTLRAEAPISVTTLGMKLKLSAALPKAPDGNLRALQNFEQLLLALRNFGHLRLSEIARMVWPHSPVPSAEEMARRTLRRAHQLGLVLSRHNALGGRSFILTAKGAAEVKRRWDLRAAAGYDIQSVMGATFRHRTLATAYLAERSAQGHRVWGEHALNKGWGPISREVLIDNFHKFPDGLIAVCPETRGYDSEFTIIDWIEVESSYKSADALERVLAVAWRLGTAIDTAIIDRLVLVYDGNAQHEKRIIRAAMQLAAAHSEGDNQAVFESIDLARCSITLPLRLRHIETVSLMDAVSGHMQLSSTGANRVFQGAMNMKCPACGTTEPVHDICDRPCTARVK